MKILHTADIHLKEVGDERWKALEKLLEIAKKENVDLFIISGDLFDSKAASDLRDKLRPLFSSNDFEIIILPGNHDADVYRKGYRFGENVQVISGYTPIERDEVRIFGLPFEKMGEEEVRLKLRELEPLVKPDKKNILLYHGELLDVAYTKGDFGEEDEDRGYMPVRLSYFKSLNFDYVLAGHFHSKFYINKIEDGKYFVYPGSPVSITTRETGRRKVNLFELGEEPRAYELDTMFYTPVKIYVDFMENENPLEILEKRLDEVPHEAIPLLSIDGFYNSSEIGITEEELVKKIKEICKQRGVEFKEENYRIKDAGEIFEDEIFLKFRQKLMQKEFDEDRKREVLELFIKALKEVKLKRRR